MRALDLFCGAGGASLGLKRAGCSVVGFDKWAPAVASHQANGMEAVVADLAGYDWGGEATPDLLWASPPCQPFSAAGKGLGEWDDRDAVPAYLSALATLAPPVTIMENVRGLTFKKHRPYLDRVVSEVQALGYAVEWKVVDAADYGVPQNRQRLILIGRRDRAAVSWPAKSHSETGGDGRHRWVSMADALGWDEDDGIAPFRGSGMRERHGDRPVRLATRPAPTITAGFNRQNWHLLNRRESRKWRELYGQGRTRSVNEPAPTISGEAVRWNWGEPDRAVTKVAVREAAILQGFPEDFVFAGSKSAQFQQIGNAVPPRLAQVLAEANLPAACLRSAA